MKIIEIKFFSYCMFSDRKMNQFFSTTDTIYITKNSCKVLDLLVSFYPLAKEKRRCNIHGFIASKKYD